MQKRRKTDETLKIPGKANRILNIVLVGMVLIVLRIWHLAVIQHDEKVEESRRPQRRVVMEPARRGTIRDRFNVPLALNKLQYNVAVLHSQIRRIPTVQWDKTPDGKRVKRFMRREYIKALSNVLGEELQMDPERIEDLIHAKSALYNQIPFVLKENIHEQEYYRLKMLEKDWLGISVQRVPVRHYPKGKVASDIIGYMGAISQQEYEKILQEVKSLEDYIQVVDSGEPAFPPAGVESVAQARRRLKDLQEQAYTMSDSVGKSGVEGNFDNILRGFRGKKSFYSDARGNFLRELPGTREPLSGKRLLLTISSELQEYAEQLLIENEKIRQPCMSRLGGVKRTIPSDKDPWIKGGAIVAMDPHTGEILAMASHPRYDPNDFIATGSPSDSRQRKANIHKWFENEVYLGAVWDMQRPMEREEYNNARGIYLHEQLMSWPVYLSSVLAKNGAMHNSLLLNGTVQDAVQAQRDYRTLAEAMPFMDASQLFSYFYHDHGHLPHGKKTESEHFRLEEALASHAEEIVKAKAGLDRHFDKVYRAYDKVLMMDLLRTVIDGDRFSDDLLKEAGWQSLSRYKEVSGAMVKVRQALKALVRERYHETDFKTWRQEHEKEFLKEKRIIEKTERRYARPYIDYLDNLENVEFQAFWQTHSLSLLTAFLKGPGCVCQGEACPQGMEEYFNDVETWHQEILNGAHRQMEWYQDYAAVKEAVQGFSPCIAMEYLQSLRSYADLERPLLGSYRHLRKGRDGIQREKHLAAAFYPRYGYGYGRSQAYRQATTQGSIFKLVTAYEALVQKYNTLEGTIRNFEMLNPLNIDDHVTRRGKEICVGFHADGTPITRHYKGGRMPRSLSSGIGPINVLGAIERSSNPYFALLAADVLQSPNDLARAAREFSYGSKTGIDLPGEIAGNIPGDLDTNRTGLHSFSIGQHTLVVTPLQTSVMLSSLVNGGKVLKPKIVDLLVGKEPRRGQELVPEHGWLPYQEILALAGIDFPLFIASDAEKQKSLVKKQPTEVRREIFLPEEIRKVLVEGMRLVVERTQGESLSGLTRLYRRFPEAIKAYTSLKTQLIGKTSTAESVENIDLEFSEGTNLYTHVWFGGVAYDADISRDMDKGQFLFNDSQGKPELVVVVYLRYGGYGKEAAPVAAQVAKKWKEIKGP